MTEKQTFYPSSLEDWRTWLEKNHRSEQSVWLILNKKASGKMYISWSNAVDQALCFGWIDSTKRPIDQEKYMQYFCRRKPKSNWSRINKEKVAKLIQNKQMTTAGFESIATAKKNGSWNILDDIEALVVPEDLIEKLSEHEGAADYFEGLSNSHKKILLYWVGSAKRTETREKRILEVAQNASEGLKPKQFR